MLKKIIDQIREYSKTKTHPDNVAKLYEAMMDVNYEIGKEMLRIRENESK